MVGLLKRAGLAGLVLAALPVGAPAMMLDAFLLEVGRSNAELAGLEGQARAAELRSAVGDQLFVPRFYGEVSKGNDGMEFNPPLMDYDHIALESFDAGFTGQTPFGLKGRLHYQLLHIEYVDAPLLRNHSAFYDAIPALELSMPLLAHGFGRSARAQQEQILGGFQAEAWAAKAKRAGLLMGAKNAYWRLAAAREVLSIQDKALTQGEAILKHVERKAGRRLGERSDVLQARGLVAMRRLELTRARGDAQAAVKDFNTLLDRPLDSPVDGLDPIPFEALTVPSEGGWRRDRWDLKAAEAQLRAAQAGFRQEAERSLPVFDVFGKAALNGRGLTAGNAYEAAREAERPTLIAGVKLDLPLDPFAARDAYQGARLSERSLADQLRQKKLDQERDWQSLVQRLKDARMALEESQELVAAQSAKLADGRRRLEQGRATTYEVLLFELDHSQAQLLRVQAASAILTLQAGLDLYAADATSVGGR